MLTPEKRAHLSSIARLGGLSASATMDTAVFSQTGRNAFRASFAEGHSCRVCPEILIPTDLPAAERDRRADALWRGHFARLARR